MKLAAFFLFTAAAFGATNFSEVTGWIGSFQSEAHSSGVFKVESWDFRHLATGTIRADKWDNAQRGWTGKLQAHVSINNWRKIAGDDFQQVDTWQFDGDIERTVVIRPSFDWATYSVELVTDLSNLRTPTIYVDGVKVQRTVNGMVMLSTMGQLRWYPAATNMGFQFPSSGNILQGTKSFPDTLPTSLVVSTEVPPFPFELNFDLKPLGANGLEVLVSADKYDTWRPEGSISEELAGNTIKISARLVSKDGSTPAVKVRRFRFELVNVSSEPGVCMNFPREEDGPKRDPDLQFEQAENRGLTLEGGKFKMTAVTLPGVYTEASAVVSSFDWGGVGNVHVVAELEDGSTINGHPEGAPEGKDLRLPKAKEGSMIPEAWLNAHNAADKADDADDDEAPIGDGHTGDGLTLYEEYRGFYENREHVDGDPHKKDLFIYDAIGDRTLAGIAGFRLATGLDVHSKLASDEMPKSHIINANHGDGAHVVDQHGDVIISSDVPFAVSYSKTDLPPGPPKNTDFIMIPYTHGGDGSPAGQRQVLDYYEKTIAHELSHSVGVWHHGEGDTKEKLQLGFPGFAGSSVLEVAQGPLPNITLTGPTLVAGTERANYRVVHVLSEENVDDGQALLDNVARNLPNKPSVQSLVNVMHYLPLMDFYVGEKNAQHSGAERCLMRYEFALAYRKEGDPNTFYFIGDNPAGDVLCTSATGTGINSAGRKPQSRHGDAAAKRGDCTHQLCVNDRMDHSPR